MGLVILRSIFLMVCAGIGVYFINSGLLPRESVWLPWAAFLGVMFLAFGIITIDVAVRRKRLDAITAVYFGLLVGLFMTYILGLALLPLQLEPRQQSAMQLVLGAALCYICISVLMQTRNDFRFIIPYVEFAKELKGSRPAVLDTSVVIDGRIADVAEAGVFDGRLVMPQFVISELQSIADSSDRMRRSRGRRGLDVLNRLRGLPQIDLEIFENELPEFSGQSVDLKLVTLAKHLQGKLITNDYNLNKVAKLQDVPVINLNDLANALKPVFLPGEHLDVRIVKPGEEVGQGVGYLEDGTMVVVEGGRDQISRTVGIVVTSVLQTSAGRMIFGRYDGARE
ncbi:MAG: PIN/TRAM domain-containing protein [Planctomycetota bacterium]